MTHYPPTVTPIEKIGDHLYIRPGDADDFCVPIGAVTLKSDLAGIQIVFARLVLGTVAGWTIPELLRVMYPPTSYTTSGKPMPPIEQPADWDLDLSEIENERAPRIRPGSLPARALDELDDDWATASIVAERLGGVAMTSTSQALRSLCERGLVERAKHPVTGHYMYRRTGVVPTGRKVRGSSLADDIMGALRRHGSPMAARQIIGALPDRNASSLRHALYRMVRSGQLRKGPHPVYGVSVYSIADEEAGE